MQSALQPGYVLAGKYELSSQIGVGGMGEVWRAKHLTLNADVAVKFMHASMSAATDASVRFVREAQAAAALRSPHVVQILDYGVDDGVAYMVMELLEGESLAKRLQRPPMPPEELARIMTHVARALGKAHDAGIVHRDLKPDNVYLTHADDELIAKVLDFGIAKVASTAGVEASTRSGAILGTPYYMSPEQAEGNRKVDFRTDIWAMGVIAYEALTGQRPFDSDAFGNLLLRICTHPLPVPSQVARVPSGFDEWFATAVNRDPNQRFKSAKEAAEALNRICGGASPSVSQPEPAPAAFRATALAATNPALARTVQPAPRSRVPLLLGVGLGVVVLGGGGAWYASSRVPETPAVAESSAPEPPPVAAPAAEPAAPLPSSEPEEPKVEPKREPDASVAAPRTPAPRAKPAPVVKAPPKPSAKPPAAPGIAKPEDLL